MSACAFSFYAVIAHPSQNGILLLRDGKGWTLPRLSDTTPYPVGLLNVTHVNRMVREQLGLHALTLYNARIPLPLHREEAQFSFLRPRDPDLQPPSDAIWVNQEEIAHLSLPDIQREVLKTRFEEAESDRLSEPFLPWWKTGWFDEAACWVNERLNEQGRAPTGEMEQLRSWHRSTVYRIPTDQGDAYFKAAPPHFSRETGLTAFLSRWQPDRFPNVLAHDTGKNRLLLTDMGGIGLDESEEAQDWEDALRAFARLQIASLGMIEGLLSNGCQDLRWPEIAERIEWILRSLPELLEGCLHSLSEYEHNRLLKLIPRLQRLCEEAGNGEIPCTFEHGDFGASNVQMTQNGPVFFDASEGSVAHPFIGLATFLDDYEPIFDEPGMIERLKSAYFEEWSGFASHQRCEEILQSLEPFWAFHMSHADALSVWRGYWTNRPLMPNTGAEWSVRTEQGSLLSQLRRLLEWEKTQTG